MTTFHFPYYGYSCPTAFIVRFEVARPRKIRTCYMWEPPRKLMAWKISEGGRRSQAVLVIALSLAGLETYSKATRHPLFGSDEPLPLSHHSIELYIFCFSTPPRLPLGTRTFRP
ncbi:hypothetical protein BJX64DRAFT_77825 [Aspergillus heterothallicus]